MSELGLEVGGLRRVEEQLHVVPHDDIELADCQRDPDSEAGWRTWRYERVEQGKKHEASTIDQVEAQHSRVTPDEAGTREQPADCCAAIFDHDTDPRIVEHDIARG